MTTPLPCDNNQNKQLTSPKSQVVQPVNAKPSSLYFFPFIVSGRTFCLFFTCFFTLYNLIRLIFCNSRCDLSKHNQRHWETEYCASQFVICWPSKLVPIIKLFCKNWFLLTLYLAFSIIFWFIYFLTGLTLELSAFRKFISKRDTLLWNSSRITTEFAKMFYYFFTILLLLPDFKENSFSLWCNVWLFY